MREDARADIEGIISSRQHPRLKLDTVDRASVWDTTVCMTSDVPWDATFIEERHCVGYTLLDSVYVSAWGTIDTCYWNGGTVPIRRKFRS